MNRREALKNLGMGAGIIVVGPTTLNLLQSCKNDRSYDWEPVFLSDSNGFALKQIMETIIPGTDTPGADDLNLAQFIDSYFDEVASEDHQKEFQRTADAFSSAFRNRFDKDQGDGTPEEYKEIVERYLVGTTPEEREAYEQRETASQDPMDKGPDLDIDTDAGAFSYLKNVRELAIWAWKTSEEIGEEVLWYDPIPGIYIPCGDVNELGEGKAMSL